MFEELYCRPGAARAVHGRDARHLRGRTSRRSRRSSISRATRRCATSAARPGCCRCSSRSATRTCSCTSFDLPAGRADRRSDWIAQRRARRPRDDGVRRLLHGPAAEGRRHHDGHDPPRLEPREEEAPRSRRAYDALPPGGAFIAIENLIDDARRENAFGLMMSLNMLIEFGDAFDFTGADFWGWCREAGFQPLRGACTSRARAARRSPTSSTLRHVTRAGDARG